MSWLKRSQKDIEISTNLAAILYKHLLQYDKEYNEVSKTNPIGSTNYETSYKQLKVRTESKIKDIILKFFNLHNINLGDDQLVHLSHLLCDKCYPTFSWLVEFLRTKFLYYGIAQPPSGDTY